MIGGRLLADGFGRGGSSDSPWARHGTALVLVLGLAGGLVAHLAADGAGKASIAPIIVAQACTILGGPALAAALIYLAVWRRPEKGAPITPVWMVLTLLLGFATTLVLAFRTALKLVG